MNITSIVKVSTQGVSRPYVCTCEDGQAYWCKGNHTGLRALMLEWVCAKIAHAVSLPVPEFHITEELRDTVTPSFLEAVWSEMPTAWTDAGESVLSLGEVTSALLGGNQ